MNKEELDRILEKHNLWLYNQKGGERADLRRADLSGADLRRADLSGADLRRADLSGADLRRANLIRADLSGADLRRANLRRADLSGAYLRRANLRRADLSGAYLSGADLYGANLNRVDLYGADLSYSKGIMSFIGEKHLLVYFKYKDTYYFKIGCITKTAKEWLKEFEDIGKNHGYGDSVQIYGDIIKLFSQYDLLEG